MFGVAYYLRDVDQQGAHCRHCRRVPVTCFHPFFSIQHLYHLYSAASDLVLGRGGPKQR